MEAAALYVTDDVNIGRMVDLNTEPLMTISPEGTLSLHPEASPHDVAQAIADAYSALHREDKATIQSLTALLSECRAVLAGLGLRSTNRAFWKALDEALGLAPTDITSIKGNP